MATNRDLEIVLKVRDEASSKLKGLQGTLKGMEPAFKTMAVAGAAAFGALTAGVMSSIEAANEAAEVQAQLGSVLKSTGGAAGVTADMALELSKALQKQTTYGDEAILSAENMLLTFTSIGKEVFPQALQTVLDMSTALGTDLKSSAIQVGKALQDPVLGVTALRRVGVSFNDAQLETIKNMVESGKTMEAQRFILAELTKEFGGSAAAQTETFSGRVKMLREQLGDMQETIGNALLPVLTDLLGRMVPVVEEFAAWAEANPKTVAAVLEWGGALSGAVGLLGALGLVIPKVEAGIKAIGAALIWLNANPAVAILGSLTVAGLALANAAAKAGDAFRGLNAAISQGQSVDQQLAAKLPKMSPEEQTKALRILRQNEGIRQEAQATAAAGDNVFSAIGYGFSTMLKEGAARYAGTTPAPAYASRMSSTPYASTAPAGPLSSVAPQYNFTFNGDVVDRDKLIRDLTGAIDRKSALKLTAGV